MPEFWARRTPDSVLIPSDQQSVEVLEKLKVNKDLCFVTKVIRNPKFHRKMFSLLGTVYKFEQIEECWPSFDVFRHYLLKAVGEVVEITHPNSETELVIKSMSFDGMDQTDFEDAIKKIQDYLMNEFLPKYFSGHALESMRNLIWDYI